MLTQDSLITLTITDLELFHIFMALEVFEGTSVIDLSALLDKLHEQRKAQES